MKDYIIDSIGGIGVKLKTVVLNLSKRIVCIIKIEQDNASNV